jgi:hypothetical protein
LTIWLAGFVEIQAGVHEARSFVLRGIAAVGIVYFGYQYWRQKRSRRVRIKSPPSQLIVCLAFTGQLPVFPFGLNCPNRNIPAWTIQDRMSKTLDESLRSFKT